MGSNKDDTNSGKGSSRKGNILPETLEEMFLGAGKDKKTSASAPKSGKLSRPYTLPPPKKRRLRRFLWTAGITIGVVGTLAYLSWNDIIFPTSRQSAKWDSAPKQTNNTIINQAPIGADDPLDNIVGNTPIGAEDEPNFILDEMYILLNRAYSAGVWDTGDKYATEILDIHPTHKPTLMRQADSYFERPDCLVDALEAYESYIQVDPISAEAYAKMARVKATMGDTLGAVDDFEYAYKIADPEYKETLETELELWRSIANGPE
ncbi:MAG: hypothetical protein KKG59_03000 [Nanoarchaeota archaeon]|nr:hypothetical protein [Nanoarchaeota archaeon]